MHLVDMSTLLILLGLGRGYHHPRGQDITTSLLLALLGATGDEVVGVIAVVESILRPSTPSVLVFGVEPREPTSQKHQLLIPEALHLLLCNGQQRKQSKHSK
jgi:hypothetical protein